MLIYDAPPGQYTAFHSLGDVGGLTSSSCSCRSKFNVVLSRVFVEAFVGRVHQPAVLLDGRATRRSWHPGKRAKPSGECGHAHVVQTPNQHVAVTNREGVGVSRGVKGRARISQRSCCRRTCSSSTTMSAAASRTSTIFTIAGVTVLGGLLAYAVYFDYKRRNDHEFRKKLSMSFRRSDARPC